MLEEMEPLNDETTSMKFLKAVKRNHRMWDNDKQFAKIVKKMETEKNLKTQEFESLLPHPKFLFILLVFFASPFKSKLENCQIRNR